MCLYPRLIENKKYIANKKNKGIVPTIKDKRVLQVPVGCGKCMECRKQKSRNWQVRLHEEIRHDNRGKFVTLSFSDKSIIKIEKQINGLEGYNLDNEIATKAVRKFLERWRKQYTKSIKHWFITELGQRNTERIHIHGIIWTNQSKELIEKKWQYGNVWIGDYVNEKTINYIVKYISKSDIIHKEYNPKVLTSPGIGKEYIKRKDSNNNKYKEGKTKEVYRTRKGIKMALPIYYRNKIYNEEEREKLWLEKLDEQVRWINGIKIDISKGEEVYYKRLELERIKNERYNYGDNKIDWNRRRYENERRRLKIKERYARGKKR